MARPINNSDESGGVTSFRGASTAGNGTFTNNGAMFEFSAGGSTGSATRRAQAMAPCNNGAGQPTFPSGASDFGSGSTVFDGNLTAILPRLSPTAAQTAARRWYNCFSATPPVGHRGLRSSEMETSISSLHNAPGVTISSLEGDGNVFLRANSLTVGSNFRAPQRSPTIGDSFTFLDYAGLTGHSPVFTMPSSTTERNVG